MATAELILQILLRYGPDAAKLAQQILSKPEPTQADWDGIFSLAERAYQYTFPITPVTAPPPNSVPPVGPPTCPAGYHWLAAAGAPGGGACVPD